MKNILTELRNIIHSDFHYTKDSGAFIILEESQAQSTCNPIRLIKDKVQTFTIELDKVKSYQLDNQSFNTDIHPLLSDGLADLKKQCDYLIFCVKQNELFALMVELKSGNATGWTRQTKAGESIAHYLLGILENYTRQNIISNTKFYHLLFSNQNTNNPKGRKQRKFNEKAFEYQQDTTFNFQFTQRPCGQEYSLSIFLR